MDPVRDALYDLLKADATLMAMLPDGDVYHQRAPQNAQTPLLTIGKQSGVRTWMFAGAPMKPQLWLVKAVDLSESAGVAENIDARAELVLNDAVLNVTGYATMFLRRESDVNYLEENGADSYQHVGGMYRLIVEAS